MSESDAAEARRLAWFHEARYGMFLHWGPYAVAGRGEWVMNRERIPVDEYTERYVMPWHAEHYRPEEWAALAREAGMGYVVLTARHHDGFALWPTEATDFHAGRLGPQRDLVGPFVEAVRQAGLRVGLYYSPASWTHPDYPGAFFRDWPSSDDWADDAARQRYIAYYRRELDELMTRYGRIDLLWYDGCIPGDLEGAATNAMVRARQPDILISPRNGPPSDFDVCEQAIHPAPPGRAWEACLTLRRDTWGYHAGDPTCKTPRDILEMLITTASNGGNLLLNVGPRPDGTIPEDEAAALRDAGAWLKRNPGWLSDSGRSPFSWNNNARVTVKGSTVYLHFLSWPGEECCWAECANRVTSARWLATGEAVDFRQEGARLWLSPMPNPLPDAPIATLALTVEGEPAAYTRQTSFWIAG